MTDVQPQPGWLSTFTGMTVAPGAVPFTEPDECSKPSTVLVTCVPCESVSCSHFSGCDDTVPTSPPPPPNDRGRTGVTARHMIPCVFTPSAPRPCCIRLRPSTAEGGLATPRRQQESCQRREDQI